MRVAIFVTVVVAHVVMVLLLAWSSRREDQGSRDEESITRIFLPPLVPEPQASPTVSQQWRAPLLYGSPSSSSHSMRLNPLRSPEDRVIIVPGELPIYTINDHCQLVVFPFPFLGCRLGKLPVNGELFRNMHPPVKYGDWDWRAWDP